MIAGLLELNQNKKCAICHFFWGIIIEILLQTICHLKNWHKNSSILIFQAVIQNMKVTCKCHGVSGSCSLITCWQQLAPFRKVGDHLQEKYGKSTRVKTTRTGRLRVRRKVNNIPTANDLVFLDKSPNYCHLNDTIGTLGEWGISFRSYSKTVTLYEALGLPGIDFLWYFFW